MSLLLVLYDFDDQQFRSSMRASTSTAGTLVSLDRASPTNRELFHYGSATNQPTKAACFRRRRKKGKHFFSLSLFRLVSSIVQHTGGQKEEGEEGPVDGSKIRLPRMAGTLLYLGIVSNSRQREDGDCRFELSQRYPTADTKFFEE